MTSPAGAAELATISAPSLEALILVGEEDEVAHTEISQTPERIGFETWLTRDTDDAETVAPFTMPEPDAPAVLGYTSGTTGRAKGALLLQRNLLANIRGHHPGVALDGGRPSAADAAALPCAWADGRHARHAAHWRQRGPAPQVRRRRRPRSTINTDPTITMFFGVPTMYGRLLAEAEHWMRPRVHCGSTSPAPRRSVRRSSRSSSASLASASSNAMA